MKSKQKIKDYLPFCLSIYLSIYFYTWLYIKKKNKPKNISFISFRKQVSCHTVKTFGRQQWQKKNNLKKNHYYSVIFGETETALIAVSKHSIFFFF